MPTTSLINNRTYHYETAADGWSSGPCPTAASAEERVRAYEQGEVIAENAPGQASVAQMRAFNDWGSPGGMVQNYVRMYAEITRMTNAALRDGLHSEAWIIASAEMSKWLHLPCLQSVEATTIQRSAS